ncbi:MAG: hypothetical protein R6W92_06245 [Desulfocurvibacter africanus]
MRIPANEPCFAHPRKSLRSTRLAVFLLLSALLVSACAPKAPPLPEATVPPEYWGIEPVGLFVEEWGQRSEFRYHVTDPEAALAFMSRPVKAILVREKSGERYELPMPVRTGNQELLELNPAPWRVYYMRFRHVIFPISVGESMSLIIGNMRVQGLEARDFNDLPPGLDSPEQPVAAPEDTIHMPGDEPNKPFFSDTFEEAE